MNLISSLRAKILILLLLPLVAALSLAGHLVLRGWDQYQAAKTDLSHGHLISSVSMWIHELQIERGKTSLFLNGALSSQELSKKRIETDGEGQGVAKALSDPSLRREIAVAAQEIPGKLEKIRSQVDQKADAAQMAAAYGNLIDQLISLEVMAARLGTFEGKLSGPIMLDIAKENSGKIRALLTNVLAADKPISMAQFASLQYLMASINANLHSPLLKVSKEGAVEIEKFGVSEDWKKIDQIFKTVSEKSTEGKYGEDPKVFFETITRAIERLSQIVLGDLSIVESEIEHSKTQAERAIFLTMAGTLLGLLLIGFFAYLVIRAITRPIQQSVQELNESAGHVMSAFEQLRSASHQMSSGSAQSAASLEETVASVEEISGMINNNADNSRQAAQLSKEGFELATQGELQLKQLITNMAELSDSSKKIEDIIGIIDDIAFQINLLALNAAVEAARAGEQGKGFAVVAEAVRELAQRSAVAAKDIGSLIQESVGKTKQGMDAADSSGSALTNIVSSVKNTSVLIEEISNSSQEQAKGLSQITKAMNELDGSTQSNAASAEQTSASAESLAEQAHRMQDLVERLNRIVEGNNSASLKKAA